MSTSIATPIDVPPAVLPRLIDEGHTTSAWFGTDILTAVSEVDADTAARRPAPGRHNIGELALHHAYWTREVRKRLTGGVTEPFPVEGEDWFEWPTPSVPWALVRETLDTEVRRLREAIAAINSGTTSSPLTPDARFDQVLGIAGHAAYHAGQIQLVKRLI